MLSGDIFPTSGSAEVGGHDILTNQLAVRRLMGYCPQFDALFGLLTAREHLQFYARIKGVPEDKMDRIVNGMLHYLSLEEYADRPAGTYSGGNKRKLSVAIALIGDPPVVFLDEPSTGMDPVARRFMWKFISDTMEGRAVILTTHSMEECEALCHRIGIMVGGRLRCLGTAQHLKSKYGSGYQLDVNGEAEKGDHVYNGVLELFPGARLLERHDSVMKFQLSGDYASGSLADIFEKMEQNKRELCIIEYSVSQTSLEQIFIHFAKQQDEEKGVATGFQNVKGLDTEMQTQPRILRSPLSKFSQEKLPSLQ
jgi:ABC-type multidrug transport system ATPase subunit